MGILNRLQMWGQWLTTDPAGFALYIVYLAAAILLALMLHEIAHGYVAYRCGDPTAKMMGRLSMDPRKHLDPIGTVCMFFLGFGWAKPVPVNPRNFRHYRRDDFMVSIAGVTVNFCLFLLSTALAVALNGLLWKPEVVAYYGSKELLTGLGFQGLISSGVGELNDLFQTPWLQYIQRFLLLFGSINLSLAVFNLLPIPPLDGFHLVDDLFFKGRLKLNQQLFQIMQIIMLVALATGAFSSLLTTVTNAIENGVLNLFLLIAGKA